MKERLSRLERVHLEAPVFFITCSTHQRKKILANDAVHACFRAFGREAENRNILVGRYVIMPDHLHFFVHLHDSTGLSSWMKSLKNTLSMALRSAGVVAPHWQKGYFDHLMRSDESCSEKWIYVRLNPVRHGLTGTPDEWPYQGELCRL